MRRARKSLWGRAVLVLAIAVEVASLVCWFAPAALPLALVVLLMAIVVDYYFVLDREAR